MLKPEYDRCPVCSAAPVEIVYYEGSAMCKFCKIGLQLQKLHEEIKNEENELKELRFKSLAPHLARESRKHKGYIEGNLICIECGSNKGKKNRQRTAYVNDEENFIILCPKCQKKEDEYWDDMWNEYYSGLR